MKKNDKDRRITEEESKRSVADGKKMIETEKKISGKQPEKATKDEKKDAAKWRNEG